MATKVNTVKKKNIRKKATRIGSVVRPGVVTLTKLQARNILVFAAKHGKSMKFLETKLANI